jgi:hypothetical protein
MAALKKPSILPEDSDSVENTMDDHSLQSSGQYTCNEYRAEMILLALQNKLQQPNLNEMERRELLQEIARVEKIVGLT